MESKMKVSPQAEVILVDDKRWNKIIENQIKFIEVVKEWMHGCVMENVRKIKIKLENIWIDLMRAYMHPSAWSTSLDSISTISTLDASMMCKAYALHILHPS